MILFRNLLALWEDQTGLYGNKLSIGNDATPLRSLSRSGSNCHAFGCVMAGKGEGEYFSVG